MRAVAPQAVPPAEPPGSLEDAVCEWMSCRSEVPLAYVKASRVDGRPDLCVARCDFDKDWCGTFGCYGVADGRIVWEARPDVAPTEQSILSVRAFRIPQCKGPVIEVYGMTHCGNGSLYLYELMDRRLVLLLRTRAVDFHENGVTFVGGRLHVCALDLDGDRNADIRLTGAAIDLDEDGSMTAIRPCLQVFFWRRGGFVEDLRLRVGLWR